MKTTHIQRVGGFTLVEVMISTVIFSFVLVAILALASHSFGYLNDIRRRARSSQILQQRMEDIRLLNWTQLQTCPATFQDPSDPTCQYVGTVSQTPYDWYHGSATVMQVTLTATWTNRTGRVRTNTLTTLVSNGGLNKFIF